MPKTSNKPINITNYTVYGGGSFSSYYKLNKTEGLKVLISWLYPSIKALKRSRMWRKATSEATSLRKTKERYKYIPECYGAVPVKFNNGYYAGIYLQHINGTSLHELIKDEDDRIRIGRNLFKRLEYAGVIHHDLHDENIIVVNNEYWVIDLDPDYVQLLDGQE